MYIRAKFKIWFCWYLAEFIFGLTLAILGALALMNTHYDHPVNYEEVAELFFQLFPRKVEMENLIFDLWYVMIYVKNKYLQ